MFDLSNAVVTDISETYTVTALKGKKADIENRKWYGLSFCNSGKITYTFHGKKIISEPGFAVFHPKNSDYTLFNNESGYFPLINFQCVSGTVPDEMFRIPLDTPEEYLSDYEKIRNAQLTHSGHLREMEVLYRIIRRLDNEKSSCHSVLTPIIRHINQNFCKEIRNSELADIGKISEVYMCRLFMRDYGTSPRQYILDMRFEYAKRLLSESNDSIENIAIKCGFSSGYHFYRFFKEKSGVSPSVYQSNNRIISI